MKALDYETLREAVAGTASAFRAVTDLDPAGGEGDKLFPPTYQGGVYAREDRIIGGQVKKCVLLDSVQSQANRLEMALLEWHRSTRGGDKPLPLVQIDFRASVAAEAGIFTALEAPHRIADAVFLASEIEEDAGDGKKEWKRFRHPKDVKEGSRIGRQLDAARAANATDLFGLCPTALLFGMWDSHGARGGLGEKFQRVLVSEIFGVGVTLDNKRPASRVDPLLVVAGESLPIAIKEDRTWELTAKSKGASKLSAVGLGNVTPSLDDPKTKALNHGGVAVEFARQIAVLSLPALRRLRFPMDGTSEEEQASADIAARATLAALGLAALARQWATGFSLRSRCDMVPRGELVFELLRPGKEEEFTLSVKEASELLKVAAAAAKKCQLPWPTEKSEPPWVDGCLTLRPSKELAAAVAKSRQMATEERGEQG